MISLIKERMASTVPGSGYFSTRVERGSDLLDFDAMDFLPALPLAELNEVFSDDGGHRLVHPVSVLVHPTLEVCPDQQV